MQDRYLELNGIKENIKNLGFNILHFKMESLQNIHSIQEINVWDFKVQLYINLNTHLVYKM
jgi:hypothetical protein